eukprot:965766-Amphidinium_carterae.1
MRRTWRGPCRVVLTQPTLLVRPQKLRKSGKSRVWWMRETSRTTRLGQPPRNPQLCTEAGMARALTRRSGSKSSEQTRLRDRPSTEKEKAVGLLARPQARPTNGTPTGATGTQKELARPLQARRARKAQASAQGQGKAVPGAAAGPRAARGRARSASRQ